MRLRSIHASCLWPLLLAACASPGTQPNYPDAQDAREERAAAVEALRSRLPSPPVGAFVRLRGDAKLFPSASKQPAPKPKNFAPGGLSLGLRLKLLADQGDTLKVATVQGELAIEGYIPREHLVPVLAEEVSETFPDGSGYVACEGLRLGLVEGRIVAAAPSLSNLQIRVPESKVALGFSGRACSPLPALAPETEVACREGEPLQLLRRGGMSAPAYSHCNLQDWRGDQLGGPTLNGAPLDPSLYPMTEEYSVAVHRQASDRVLFTMWLPDLILRVAGRSGHVASRAGGGRIGSNRRGPRVPNGAPAYFHDGSLAGRYVGPGFSLELLAPEPGRICFVAAVEGGICFDPADLEPSDARDRRPKSPI